MLNVDLRNNLLYRSSLYRLIQVDLLLTVPPICAREDIFYLLGVTQLHDLH